MTRAPYATLRRGHSGWFELRHLEADERGAAYLRPGAMIAHHPRDIHGPRARVVRHLDGSVDLRTSAADLAGLTLIRRPVRDRSIPVARLVVDGTDLGPAGAPLLPGSVAHDPRIRPNADLADEFRRYQHLAPQLRADESLASLEALVARATEERHPLEATVRVALARSIGEGAEMDLEMADDAVDHAERLGMYAELGLPDPVQLLLTRRQRRTVQAAHLPTPEEGARHWLRAAQREARTMTDVLRPVLGAEDAVSREAAAQLVQQAERTLALQVRTTGRGGLEVSV